MLKGIPAAAGIAIGTAFVIDSASPSVETDEKEVIDPEVEIARLRAAQASTSEELLAAIELATRESASARTILESYHMIATDEVMTKAVEDRIRGGVSAETAVQQEFDVHKTALYQSKDAFLRGRVEDLDHVMERLLAVLRNRIIEATDARQSIVVSGSISPQDVLYFSNMKALGYVTEVGGINSHSCILAREFGLPAVIGIRNAAEAIHNGDTVVIDGFAGQVIVRPDDVMVRHYQNKQLEAEEYKTRLGALVREAAETTDGMRLVLKANADAPEQVDAALMVGCEGIGLVRTEMLLTRLGRYPTLEEQEVWYRDIAERAFPLNVTFRAFDIGSDKFREGIPYHEENPALGLRGIRFLLYRPDIFERQVLAILRASTHRNVRLMLPMISSVEELHEAKRLIHHCASKLASEGVDHDPAMPLGVMIETPAAALLADVFAEQVDFFSIGTNDLAQYALATDRTNELVADTFDAMHPAVMRLIAMTVGSAKKAGISVSVCGEMAGHAAATEMLVGIGIDELSVSAPLLLELKQRIRSISHEACVNMALDMVRMSTTTDVYARMARKSAT